MTALQTSHLPDVITGAPADVELAQRMIRAWQTDGIFQIATDDVQSRKTENALAASRRFFRMPMEAKARCVSEPNVLTVFPGDILQFMTGGRLLSTPHQVRLNTRERFALAYFQEPNFQACARPLFEAGDEHIHYGTHFTNMFTRCYRNASRRIGSRPRIGGRCCSG